ncbi:hypothetical protein QA584_22610 [Anaerocolumna sp. AGMB13025]|uniref:hypothetical protein n=1 Tax=Anaerocolumna sp. AGMB13025 TaxID=3039116 RepID=UPI002420033E|nr:hypothetical protein [Anaerocolumna sp. AGMB13025]WFR56378.1 hypothetical protein QA584_22610 [Anaerocolumna sp. AGMB13025]
MDFKTNYKDDIYSGNRKYVTVTNDDGTVSFVDATVYDQQGDYFGGNELNAIGQKLNGIEDNANKYTHPTSHPASMITGLPTSLPANGGSADYATSAGNASNADKVGGLQPYQLGSLAQDGGSHGTQYAATPKYNVNGDNRFRLDIYNGGGVTHGVRVGYADGADNADTVDGIHLLTSTTIPTYLPNNVLCIVYE